jgi:hypothetical protein
MVLDIWLVWLLTHLCVCSVCVLIDWYLHIPPKELKAAEIELKDTRIALCKVKSIQVEFVKHSKLSRKSLKLEKDIERIKDEMVPKIAGVKGVLGYLKVICFCVVGILISQHQQEAIFVPASMIWPVSSILFLPFGFNIHPVFVLFIAALAWQYVFATVLAAV